MPYEGLLANAFVTLFAGACYLFVGTEVHRKTTLAGARSTPAVAFFLTVAVYLIVAGLRQAAAFAGTVDPALAVLDRWTYHVVVIPAGFAIVPFAYLTALAVWGRASLARGIASAFAVVATIGVTLVYVGGITGPDVSYWGSDWSINSVAAQVMIVLFLTLPALLASVLLVYTGSHAEAGARGRRLRLVGWSCLVYYVAFTLDAFGLEGGLLLVARLATAGAALLGYAAYADAHTHAAVTGTTTRG